MKIDKVEPLANLIRTLGTGPKLRQSAVCHVKRAGLNCLWWRSLLFFVECLESQQHASESRQQRLGTDQTCCFVQLHNTDTGTTSSSTGRYNARRLTAQPCEYTFLRSLARLDQDSGD